MQSDLLLRSARVWTDPEAAVSVPQDVLLRAGRIADIGRIDAVEGVCEHDLAGRIVTAGFWNCHVHLTEEVWRRRGEPAAIQDAIDDMMLSRGFVGVVDLASSPVSTAAVIRQVDGGALRGPVILTAGTGIRPWRGVPYYIKADVPWFLRLLMPGPLTAFGAGCIAALQLRHGAHVIKLFTGSYVTPERIKPMRMGVARAAVRRAHRRGARVFAHPSDDVGVAIALDAGVDALAHVPSRTEGTAELLRRAAGGGTRIVPTLHMFAATESADESYLRPMSDALRGFFEAGGHVLFGTDVGYMRDRDTRPELVAMGRSGMSVAAILASLTTEPALFFGQERAGTVEIGNRADLTVLDTVDPHPGPADLADIHMVIREGRVLWPAR